MRLLLLVPFLLFLVFSSVQTSFAQSDYVLPYPSFMPGNTLYKVHRILEIVEKYWYFGDFGQFAYNLKESDFYLVQAKTLFEYKQYLLGYDGLIQSDAYFSKLSPNLLAAKRDGKNIFQEVLTLHSVAKKHMEVLESIIPGVPQVFYWTPEKGPATTLKLRNEIWHAIIVRKQNL